MLLPLNMIEEKWKLIKAVKVILFMFKAHKFEKVYQKKSLVYLYR